MIRKPLETVCALTVGLWVIVAGSPKVSAQSQYVGSEVCKTCHDTEFWNYKYTHWENTLHNKSLRDPDLSPGVVPDNDFKAGLDLSADPDFSKYGTSAPILSYDTSDPADSADNTSGYRVTIGNITYTIYRTYGGNGYWKQRYQTKIGNSFYILPIQYNEKTGDWVPYDPDHWYDTNNQPRYNDPTTLEADIVKKNSFERRCAGCHNSGLKVFYDDVSGEYTSSYKELNIGCEKCHGPGGPPSHAGYGFGMTGGGLNPADLATNRANEVCGQCHSRGSSIGQMGPAKFGYPWATADSTGGFVPGDSLEAFYDFVDPVNNPERFWPDGKTSKSHHQQFLDFYQSPKPTFPYHQVRCYECHEPHGSANEHDIVESIEENGLVIATENDNNTLCLACHSTHGDFEEIPKEWVADPATHQDDITAVVTKHTRHFYDPDGNGSSRCSKCHMPKAAKSAVAYDIHSHTFEAISPVKTLTYEMPNTCAVSCHRDIENGAAPFFNTGYDSTLTNWAETTDVDLAKALLYWYDNMWFKQLGGTGKKVNAVEASVVPTVDGDTTDAAWASIDWVEIPLAHNQAVWMKALYTATDLYILAKWVDPTLSMTRGGSWSYDGTNWVKSSGQSEDRIAFFWNISIPVDDFKAQGCMNKCHRDVDNTDPGNAPGSEDDVYLPAGQRADMWHMKAARSLGAIGASQSATLTVDPQTHEVTAGSVTLSGYIDDKYVGEFSAANAPDGGRYGDAGSSAYKHNRNAAKTAPLYIEKDPTDYIDAMVLKQTEIEAGEVDTVANVDAATLAADWARYEAFNAVVPERILREPSGSRADVRQAATWEDGMWYSEIHRALSTGNDDDAQFAVNHSYDFGVAVIDNGGGDAHWSTGNVLSTLNIGVTEVGEQPLASLLDDYRLSQNYPNPFNPTTTITFDLVRKGKVTLKVFNLLGQEVVTLVDKELPPGSHKVIFNGAALASGIYFYKLSTNGFTSTKKMLLLK